MTRHQPAIACATARRSRAARQTIKVPDRRSLAAASPDCPPRGGSINAASAISCCSKCSRRPAATRAGARTKSARIPGPPTTFPCRGRRRSLVRELFEELGVLRDGEWDERYLVSLRRSACSCTAVGRRALSRHRGHRARSRAVSHASTDVSKRIPRHGRVHYPDGAGREAIAARSTFHARMA